MTLLTRPHVDGTEKEFKLLRQKLSVNPVQYQLCGKPLPMPKTAKAGGSQPPAAATSSASTAPSTAEAALTAEGSTPLATLPLETKEGPDAGTNPVNTGYIKVATFSKQTTEAVKSAIKALQAQGATRYCTSSQPLSLSSLTLDLALPSGLVFLSLFILQMRVSGARPCGTPLNKVLQIFCSWPYADDDASSGHV